MVLPHFMNAGMFTEQQRVLASYPQELRAQLHVVVVDDCSPKGYRLSHKSVTVDGLASLRIFRLTKKERWNWLACRNLGAKVATTDWMLLTDIDHVMPAETLDRLVNGPLDERRVYRFARVDAPRQWPYQVSECSPYKIHNDTWLLTRQMFFSDAVGGYDERLSGCYGTSGEFRDRLMAAASACVVLTSPMIRYPREIIPDASTLPTVYTRKNDPDNDADLSQRKAARECIHGWKPLHGLTPYETVYEDQAVVA